MKQKNKKIVIIPVFCDTHLIKYQIPNIIDTINPDIIIYNEGMFPVGPESNTVIDLAFLEEYTLSGGGKRGFDYLELESIIKDAQELYSKKVRIILNKMNYIDNESSPSGTIGSASRNYVKACSNFEELGITVKEGDYIFPLEGDVFHHQESKDEIAGYLEQMEPNQGFRSKWIDFMENQYYAEKSSLKPFLLEDPAWAEQGRSRKICIRFGDMSTYKEILMQFEKNHYPMLFPTDLVTYHYAWIRPYKYKMLRYSQLNRAQEYWNKFEIGLQEANKFKYSEIDVRPLTHELHLTYRYIKFFDIDHPSHVKDHPCFVSELSDEQKQQIELENLVFRQ